MSWFKVRFAQSVLFLQHSFAASLDDVSTQNCANNFKLDAPQPHSNNSGCSLAHINIFQKQSCSGGRDAASVFLSSANPMKNQNQRWSSLSNNTLWEPQVPTEDVNLSKKDHKNNVSFSKKAQLFSRTAEAFRKCYSTRRNS